jgi:hypothetical protein
VAKLDLHLFIRAAPETVWDILSDFDGQLRWMEDLRRIDVDGRQQAGLGCEMRVTSDLFGLPVVREVMEITAWEPPTHLGVRHGGGFTGTGDFLVERVPGGSVFTWREEFQPPLGILGEMGFNLVVGPHMRRVFKRSMENLRQLAEAR